MARRLALHLTLWFVGLAALRVAVVPPERCGELTRQDVVAAIDAGLGWVERNTGDDGLYLYRYRRNTGIADVDYNWARHAGMVNTVYQAAYELDRPDLIALGDRGIAPMLERLIDTGPDARAFEEPSGSVPLGANGLLLAALVHRRLAVTDPIYDREILSLAEFVVDQQEASGAIRAYWDKWAEAPVDGVYGPFATGEAAWALTLVDEVFPGRGYAEATVPTLHYLATDRARAEGYVARLPDHWAAYTMEELPPQLLDASMIAYAERLAGYFSIRIRVEAQRTGVGANLLVRGFPGPPSGVSASGEGLARLWRLSRQDPRLAHLQSDLEARLRCAGAIMVRTQAGPDDVGVAGDPSAVEGAWFYRDFSQVDDQQHTLSMLLVVLETFREDEA